MTEHQSTHDSMTDREAVRRALQDAIAWQESFADANERGTPERADALALARRYRALLKRRYGDSRTAAERALEGATYITLAELQARGKASNG